MKFIREFEPGDRTGFSPQANSIGVLDDGIRTPSTTSYLLSMDLDSRLVIDFSMIDESIAKPISYGENDWRSHWPDSAGITFVIGGRSYDVYFPTKWSNDYMDLAPASLGIPKTWQGFHSRKALDAVEIGKTADGMSYQKIRTKRS